MADSAPARRESAGRPKAAKVTSKVPAAENTLRILKLLASKRGPMAASNIATALGLPRSSVYHLLGVMEANGFVLHLHEEQRYGTCLMRTKTLADPGSWRAWDGSGFDVRFADPYAEAGVDPTDHVCAPVSPQEIGAMVESLTYNEYLGKWVLVGSSQDVVAGRGVVVGFYWSVSDDLVSWSHRKLIAQIEMPWSHEGGDPNPVGYPSVIDPSSGARNFTTTGEEAYLYFTRFHYRNCVQTLNRDLVRVPIRFAK